MVEEIRNKTVDNYPHPLKCVPECFMTQKMRDKAVNTYPSTIKFVSECFMTQEIYDKAFDRSFFVFVSIPDKYKPQEMCVRIVSEDPFLIVCWPNKYKTQRICDEAVNDSLAALKRIPDWFVASKMIKKLYTTLYTVENILYFNEDSGNVVFACNEMGILNIDFNNINLDNNFDEDDPDTILILYMVYEIWKTQSTQEKDKW